MTVLQALGRYYERMLARGEAEPRGFSREKISFAIVLDRNGEPVDVDDLRETRGKKQLPVLRDVPAAVTRTVAIVPNFLWDKTAYSLGRTAGDDRKTAQTHSAFRDRNIEALAGSEDEGLRAFRLFLEKWRPERFDQPPFQVDMLDANIVFRLDGEIGFLHQRPAAQALIEQSAAPDGPLLTCLVTGAQATAARLHPAIKGVEGAQSSGARLVSFNCDAFTSYGKDQGDNAPTSEAAAFRYGAALNRLLDPASPNRLRIGDMTVAFWAEATGVSEASAQAAEALFGFALQPPTDAEEAAKLRTGLEAVAAGRPLSSWDSRIAPGTRFHVLGLSPNAARLSVRLWLTDSIDEFMRRLALHHTDMSVEPLPWRTPPAVQWLLLKSVAAQEKFDNIPPLLAGEVARAVLAGTRYPRTLLTAAVMRLRAGDAADGGWHAAAIRGVLAREHRIDPRREGAPLSIDRNNTNPAYRLGRLFAVLEAAQYGALGRVNATIRDRFFGAASATPASVFPMLIRNAQNHLAGLRKEGRGAGLERDIEEIMGGLPASLPRTLRLDDQGRFAIGYYHQRAERFGSREQTTQHEDAVNVD